MFGQYLSNKNENTIIPKSNFFLKLNKALLPLICVYVTMSHALGDWEIMLYIGRRLHKLIDHTSRY